MERYIVDKQVGLGSFGSVYKVMNLNGKYIALKVVKLANEVHAREAQKEVDILTSISNPCIPSLICYYNSFVQKDSLYIEMEFIDGITLLTFARKNKTNVKFLTSLIAILGDLIPGLKYLHSKGIIHRDIKPENIMIEKTKTQPKLIDVGLACRPKDEIFDSLQKNSRCDKACCRGRMGTPYFMAPETLLDGISYSESDIWGLGASIYFAATNRNVFEPKAPSIPNLKAEMKANPVVLMKTKDNKLDDLLQLMIQKDYTKRASLDNILNQITIEYIR